MLSTPPASGCLELAHFSRSKISNSRPKLGLIRKSRRVRTEFHRRPYRPRQAEDRVCATLARMADEPEQTIPGDALRRCWIDVSAANPSLADQLRPSLVGFLAFGPDREPALAGTGFVVAGNSDYALVLTAKHVLTEGVLRTQRPSARSAPSALFVRPGDSQPSIDPKKLRAVWMGTDHANLLNVQHVGYNDTLDIACCVVNPQTEHAAPFAPVSIPLDTAVPNLGDTVYQVALASMTVDELAAPVDATGKHQAVKLSRAVNIRVGVITGVHPAGFRQYRWPSFTTSIPSISAISTAKTPMQSKCKSEMVLRRLLCEKQMLARHDRNQFRF